MLSLKNKMSWHMRAGEHSLFVKGNTDKQAIVVPLTKAGINSQIDRSQTPIAR